MMEQCSKMSLNWTL